MINENVMNHLLDEFEEVIKRNGVNCMRVIDKEDFLRVIFERKIVYDGFVIVKSSRQSGIFYVDMARLFDNENVSEYS